MPCGVKSEGAANGLEPRQGQLNRALHLPQAAARLRSQPRLPASSTGRGRRVSLLRLADFCGGRRSARLQKPERCSGLPLPKYAARDAARLHIWTAAPAPPRLLLPQAAARLRSQPRLPVSFTGCGRRRCLCLLFFRKVSVTLRRARRGDAAPAGRGRPRPPGPGRR